MHVLKIIHHQIKEKMEKTIIEITKVKFDTLLLKLGQILLTGLLA